MIKKSPWYPGHVGPVRKGWYRAKSRPRLGFIDDNDAAATIVWRYWDGEKWKWRDPRSKRMRIAAFNYEDQWQGVLK